MSFTTVQNLANVKGVFLDIYTMHGPFMTELEARDFFGETKREVGFFVRSNHTLYILKEVLHERYRRLVEIAPSEATNNTSEAAGEEGGNGLPAGMDGSGHQGGEDNGGVGLPEPETNPETEVEKPAIRNWLE